MTMADTQAPDERKAAKTVAVTLQISLAPSDARHAEILLPHQLDRWGSYVDEVLLTLDLRRVGGAGQFGTDWEARRDKMLGLIEEFRCGHPTVRLAEVDYTAATAKRLANTYFGGRPIPRGDHRNGPFYCYYFGLDEARNDHVLHIDSDILCGGSGAGWLEEAREILDTRHEVLAVSPFPGPPTESFELHTQRGTPAPGMRAAYLFTHFSSRVFMLDRRVLQKLHPPSLLFPRRVRDVARAVIYKRPLAPLAEDAITAQMRRARLVRLDFLGEPPGWWSLHPPYRSERFFETLPEIVRMVENDDLPRGQRGDYDLNSSVIDWSDALAALRATRWRR
jgi:hypothetical protein